MTRKWILDSWQAGNAVTEFINREKAIPLYGQWYNSKYELKIKVCQNSDIYWWNILNYF